MTTAEYQIGQLYGVVEFSRENTNNDSAIKIIANEPFSNEKETGQYTHKVVFIGSKAPAIVSALLPRSSLTMVEKAWNAFPNCRTEFSNPFMGSRFNIVVESRHLDNDNGNSENVFNLSPEELQNRRIVKIDIASDKNPDQPPEREPRNFLSEKTGRGKLTEDWINSDNKPMMCCYKLCTVKFQIFGLQGRLEEMLSRMQKDLFIKFHKDLFCMIDKWYGLTIADIRMLEDEIKKELDETTGKLGHIISEDEEKPSSTKSTPF